MIKNHGKQSLLFISVRLLLERQIQPLPHVCGLAPHWEQCWSSHWTFPQEESKGFFSRWLCLRVVCTSCCWTTLESSLYCYLIETFAFHVWISLRILNGDSYSLLLLIEGTHGLRFQNIIYLYSQSSFAFFKRWDHV